jgi:DNA repair photolyase
MALLIEKKGSTLHDFPYSSPERKCPHFWIINVTPPGPAHCTHRCIYCYARDAIYSDFSPEMKVYGNLPELVERDLRCIRLAPPVSISNVSDPCQHVPELRHAVVRLVALLIRHGIPFFITTKGDPRFLLNTPGFRDFPYKFVAVTIEGTEDMLPLLSPGAPPLQHRLDALRQLSASGTDTVVRLDPLFPHLFHALYGYRWWQELEKLVTTFTDAGARHVIASAGRLSGRRTPGSHSSSRDRMLGLVGQISPATGRRMRHDYAFERTWSGGGFLLRRELRVDLHRRVREIVEAHGMTCAVCQELGPEADSQGPGQCEGFVLPFALKQPDGSFSPVEGCTACCHVTCSDTLQPPCGQPLLASPVPFKPAWLKATPSLPHP